MINKLFTYRTAEVTAMSPLATKSRTEVIDLVNNRLFSNCKNIAAIERTYEAFWASEGVKVSGIVLVK